MSLSLFPENRTEPSVFERNTGKWTYVASRLQLTFGESWMMWKWAGEQPGGLGTTLTSSSKILVTQRAFSWVNGGQWRWWYVFMHLTTLQLLVQLGKEQKGWELIS